MPKVVTTISVDSYTWTKAMAILKTKGIRISNWVENRLKEFIEKENSKRKKEVEYGIRKEEEGRV